MLLAYGAALRLSPPVGRAGHNREVIARRRAQARRHAGRRLGRRHGAGPRGLALLGVVITAALPTAQNIFLHATRYRTGEDVARETILRHHAVLACRSALVVALLLA